MEINHFVKANVDRTEAAFYPLHDWSPNDWAVALAGEVGELLNLLKKLRRGDEISYGDISDEIGDVLACLCLLSARLDIDLEGAAIRKFNEVSQRRGYSVTL